MGCLMLQETIVGLQAGITSMVQLSSISLRVLCEVRALGVIQVLSVRSQFSGKSEMELFEMGGACGFNTSFLLFVFLRLFLVVVKKPSEIPAEASGHYVGRGETVLVI
ncbi:hypothetical protein SUGI_0018210 [Cryptomeria japonica]|nr:hypothetical protein SUGI_0018210 [Cryptomeria japonica]